MQGNLDPSARTGLAGVIPPQQAGVGTLSSGWVDMRNFFAVLATLNVGVIGAAGTVGMKIEQATSDTGAGVKDVAGLAITPLAKAGGDNRLAAINVRQEDLDKNGGFRFVRISVTVGTAATFLSAQAVGYDARFGAGSANQIAAVVQTVS